MRDNKGKFVKGSEPYNKKTGHIIPCKRCGKEMYARLSEEKNGYKQYCSRQCKNPPVFINCKTCNKEFRIKPKDLKLNKKYCSRRCQFATVKTYKCQNCNKIQKYKQSNYGAKFCSRKCRDEARIKASQITKKCLNCGKNFTRPRAIALVQDCCSHQCGIDYWFENHRGHAHPAWKEEGISYSWMHSFLLREYGNAPFCIINDKTCSENIEWANNYHKNKNDKFDKTEIVDFTPLCESHHVRYDRYDSL